MSELSDWRRGLSNEAHTAIQAGLKPPRGIRNANPLNITSSPRYVWRGQCGVDDEGKLQFLEPRYGIRAASINLTTYHEQHGCKTVLDYVKRWSGESDVIIESYAFYVAKTMTVEQDAPIDLDIQGRQLVQAMIGFECGVPWDGRPLRLWYDYAYLRDAVGASHVR